MPQHLPAESLPLLSFPTLSSFQWFLVVLDDFIQVHEVLRSPQLPFPSPAFGGCLVHWSPRVMKAACIIVGWGCFPPWLHPPPREVALFPTAPPSNSESRVCALPAPGAELRCCCGVLWPGQHSWRRLCSLRCPGGSRADSHLHTNKYILRPQIRF